MADVGARRGPFVRFLAAALFSVSAENAGYGAGFGAVVEHPLAFPPAAVTVLGGSPGSRSEILVLANDRPLLAGHVLSDEGMLVETQTFRAPDRCGAIVQGDYNGDGKGEFALLSAGGTRIHSYLRRPAGWITRRLAPGTRATGLLSADLNADGFMDLMCYGKTLAGMIVYFGSREGLQDSSTTVLADISVADAVARDVNGDGVTDLLIADWLGNAVTLFAGLDGSAFTEALKAYLPTEPLEIAIADPAPGVAGMISVLTANGLEIRTFEIQRAGEVALLEVLRLETPASDIRLIDSDGDRRPELLASTSSGLLLAEAARGNRFGPWVNHGIFAERGGVAVRDVDGDRKIDLVAVEPAVRKLVVCANESASGPTAWPDVFATAGDPVGGVLSDVTLDGKMDLIVACRRPPVLAVLSDEGEGRYVLRQTLSIPEKPTGVIAVHERKGAPKTVLTSHAPGDEVGVISFDQRGRAVSVRTLATGDRPRVLVAARDSADALQVLVMTGSAGGHGCSLSWFGERVTGQFVERPVVMPSPARMLSACADAGGAAPVTVAALVREGDRGGLSIWSGMGLPSSLEPFATIPGSSTRLLGGCRAGRGEFTVYYSTDSRRSEIGMMTYRVPVGEWSEPVVIGGLIPDPAIGSILADLAGDGHIDLVFGEKKSGQIMLLTGASNPPLAEPRMLLKSSEARLVAVGDAGPAGGRDLFLLYDGRNSVSMVRGAIAR